MRLFNAGLFTSSFHTHGTVFNRLDENEKQKRLSNKNYLESYHYIKKGGARNAIRRDGVKIFLDSGAFSAFTLGETIDMGAYCDYILENDDIVLEIDGIKMIAPLDVIGMGEDAEIAFTEEQKKRDKHTTAWLSYKNMEEMEARGCAPLPCFHYNEPWEYLEYYQQKYKYIALGGLVRDDLHSLKIWFDDVFRRTPVNPDGTPAIKYHAFSLTSLPLMLNFPWASVDSSTWVQWSANGLILLPGADAKNGRQVTISSLSPARKQLWQHHDSLPEIMQNALIDEITSYGQDVERLRTMYYARWAFNCWAFPRYVEVNTVRRIHNDIGGQLFA